MYFGGAGFEKADGGDGTLEELFEETLLAGGEKGFNGGATLFWIEFTGGELATAINSMTILINIIFV
jgi:hypothetical protein